MQGILAHLCNKHAVFMLLVSAVACSSTDETTNGNSAAGAGSASQGGAEGEDGGAATVVQARLVNLAAASDYVVLAKSGISTVPTSDITGNLGLSPAAASFITGFSMTADSTNVFSTSPQVTGKLFAADYTAPAPSRLTKAVGDMELAFADAAGRPADFTELGAGDVGGMTLDPGVYKWGTGLLIPTDVTLSGSATAVWIFQIAKNLTVESATNVVLTGGAKAKNVFWQVGGKAVLGTTSKFEGIVLSQTSITMRTGASLNGRLLAQTAVDMDRCTVVEPSE